MEKPQQADNWPLTTEEEGQRVAFGPAGDKRAALPVDQLGVRPEAGMWAPEERHGSQHPPAPDLCMLPGEACSLP